MLWFGLLFIGTFITSIPAVILMGPAFDQADYVLGAGKDTRVTIGAFLELGLIIVNAATAIALFPIARRFSEGVALGYVGSRLFESVMIGVGLISVVSIVTLRQDFGGAGATDAASLTAATSALVAIKDWTFLFGPAFCSGFGNGILLGYLMFKSGLMPRRVAIFGMFAGVMAVGTATAVMFGAYEQMSLISFVFTGPEIIWESTIGIYLTVKAIRLGRQRLGSGSRETAEHMSAAPLPGA
jgi:hypothetical protein